MKKDQLVTLIRGIVKEEVIKVMADVVPKLLAEVVAEQIVDTQKPQRPQRPVVTETKEPSLAELIGIPTQKKSEIKYSDNPTLNNILQHTQPLSLTEAQNGMISPAQMMAQQYEHQQMESMMNQDIGDIGQVEDWKPSAVKSLGGFDSKVSSVIPPTAIPQQAVSGVPLAEQRVELDMSTIKSLTQRASKALAKSKKISEQSRPSNINFETPQPKIINE